MPSTERRKGLRRFVKQKALICTVEGTMLGECFMVDVSATGARLILAESFEVPDQIVLVLSKGAKVNRRCKVARRAKDVIGVRFDPARR